MNTIPSELERERDELEKRRKLTKICPKSECTAAGAAQNVDEFFGWRTVNGKVIPQSYCTNCRKGVKIEGAPVQSVESLPLFEKINMAMEKPVMEVQTNSPAPALQKAMQELGDNFETAQRDPGHAFKVIEQFAKQKLGLFEHAITPKHAAVLIGLATGKSNRFADDETEGRFSLLLRSEASVHELPDFFNWVMPDWDTYSGYRYNRDNTGDVECTAQRRIANALLRWGLALVAWCDEEQANREDIERKKKVREQKEKEKKAAAKAKAKAKGKKAGSRYVEPDDEDDDDEGEDE